MEQIRQELYLEEQAEAERKKEMVSRGRWLKQHLCIGGNISFADTSVGILVLGRYQFFHVSYVCYVYLCRNW